MQMTGLGNKQLPLGVLLAHLLLLLWGMHYRDGGGPQDQPAEIVRIQTLFAPSRFQLKDAPERASKRLADTKRWASREACIQACGCYSTQ